MKIKREHQTKMQVIAGFGFEAYNAIAYNKIEEGKLLNIMEFGINALNTYDK